MKFIDLLNTLPPAMSRTKAPTLLGGAVASKTLANRDAKGTGVPGRFKSGSRVMYDTRALLEWLDSRSKVA